jgi:hypothetical protein
VIGHCADAILRGSARIAARVIPAAPVWLPARGIPGASCLTLLLCAATVALDAQTMPPSVEIERDPTASSSAPAAITSGELREIISVLADDSLEGREAGTSGAARAAAYVAQQFESAGLQPLPGGYLESFRLPGVRSSSANVIGILHGADPALAHQALVIGAHYDHLGWGGLSSLSPGERAIHNGADDNASGVAGIIELAEKFAAEPTARTLVFVAFGAEELGALGSAEYVRSPAWPLGRTVAMLNLDMVGRLRQKLTIYGTGTSEAWEEVLETIPASGLEIARVPDGFGPSDHAPFYAARIPVLAFFTGVQADYHRPTDDVGKIELEGEVHVLDLVAAVIEEVADQDRQVGFTDAPVTQRQPAVFKVALGTMPDYAFAGPGVRLAAVRPGSPAAKKGLKAGDVLLRLAGREILDVYGYTAILAELEAGQAVELVYARGDGTVQTSIIPEAR